MDQDNDLSYYRRRELSARALAESARDPMIRKIHADMADAYSAKVCRADSKARPTHV